MVLKCAMCGFEHDILVQETPYLGPLCYKCFNDRYWGLQEFHDDWEDGIVRKISNDIEAMLKSGHPPAHIYKKYPIYLIENIFKSILFTDLREDIRNDVILFLFSDEYRSMKRRLSDLEDRMFVRHVGPFGRIGIVEMKRYLEELYGFDYEWSDRIDAFFIRKILGEYSNGANFYLLKEKYRGWLPYLRDAATELLHLKSVDNGKQEYLSLQRFIDDLNEQIRTDWIDKQIKELEMEQC